jgi:hypothetical protein
VFSRNPPAGAMCDRMIATCSATATRVRLKFRRRLIRFLGVRPATASNAMGV